MILWILTLLCAVRSCLAVKVIIDGKELDCSKNCVCCKGGTSKCVLDYRCQDGCVETIHGHRCHHPCPENCKTCEINYGKICNSCKDTFYDKNSLCSKSCSARCNNETCNDGGICSSCKADFEGPRCTTCIPGKYGSDCILNCLNQNCRCTTERDCISCKKGFYDSSTFCLTPCSNGCQNGSCNNDGTCDCTSKFNGTSCSKCMTGYHGTDCDKLCSVGCVNRHCSKDGTCSCLDNFEGTTCETCLIGRYGDHCDKNCSVGCNKTKGCYRNNGSCECLPNYIGDNCEECEDALYGQSCGLHCPYNCERGTCSRHEGRCILGCVDGFSGDNCTDPCNSSCATCLQNDTSHCVLCHGGYTGATCRCPPKCNCATGLDICISCTNGYANPEQQCTCQLKFCYGNECDQCINQTYYVNNNACCGCPKNCRDGVCKNGPECISGCMEGFYGLNCFKRCSVAECLQCNQTDGECLLCNKGYYLHDNGSCNVCPRNFYGYLCETKCPVNCQPNETETSCNNVGTCTYGCVDGYKGDDCTESNKQVDLAAAGSPVGYSAGIVTVVVIIGVVVAVFFLRRRLVRLFSSNKTNRSTNTTVKANVIVKYKNNSNEGHGPDNRDSLESNQLGQCHQANRLSAPMKPTSICEIDPEFDKDAIHEAESTAGVYCNDSVTMQRPKVSVDGLVEYVDSFSQDDIKAAFEKFPQGLIKPYVHSQRSENLTRNRYKGIYPYDDCRVKIRDEDLDYINASFIDGHKKRKEYIATLGPMSHQLGGEFEPFWQMVWQQKVEKIVMVTNLIENGTGKCEQYWPNVGTSKMYGEFRITCHSEDMYAEFTRRTLTIAKSFEERSIYQLHFTCWPDKGIPDDVTAIIEFRQRVLNTPTTYKGPTVVHCSAGVGRTGTYIALDILTKEGETEGAVDIPGCVVNMRQNRPNMIQTMEQYQYLHKAVVYSLTFNCTPIKADQFQQYMKTTRRADLNRQFQQLQHTVEQRSKQEANAVKRNKEHLAKNRANADIPGDENRPRLYLGLESGASDYINAVYIHGFKEKRRFLVAQTPLPETVNAFLTLVVQEHCSCIVSFEPDMDKQRNVGIYYPAENMQVLKKGSFEVSSSRETRKPHYAIRSLKIRHTRATERLSEKTLAHMQFTEWDEIKNVPLSVENFLTFLNDVEETANKQKDGPILLHCFDGAGRTGLFCVVSMLLRKMAIEHEVSVLNAVRKVKTMRRLAIPNLDQFIFCHESVMEYLRAFDKDVYANFAGSNE